MAGIIRWRNAQGIFDDMATVFSTVASKNVNDLNEGSSLGTFMRVWAEEHEETDFNIANAYNRLSLDTASGADLDGIGADEGVTRHGILAASGYMRLSKSTAAPVDSAVALPGTIVVSNGQINFVNAVSCRILQSASSWVVDDGVWSNTDILFTAQTTGVSGNTAANTITTLVTSPGMIDSVNNPGLFTGGRIPEADNDYRARIQMERDRRAGASRVAILAEALRQPDIYSAAVYEYITTASESKYVVPTPGEVWVYLFQTFVVSQSFAPGRIYNDPAVKYLLNPSTYLERMRNALEVVRGFPITLKVYEAYAVLVDPIVTVTVPKSYHLSDQPRTEAEIAQRIRTYLLNLKIGESLSEGHVYALLGIPFVTVEISFQVYRNRTHSFDENVAAFVSCEADEVIKPYGTYADFGQITVESEG